MAKQTGEEIKSAAKYPKGPFSRFRDWLAKTRFGQTEAGKSFVFGFLGKKHFEVDDGPFVEDWDDSAPSEFLDPEVSDARKNLGDKHTATAASEPPAAPAAAGMDAQLTTKASFDELVVLQKKRVLVESKLDEACAKLLDHPMVTEHIPELSAFANPQERAEFLSELFSSGTHIDRFKNLNDKFELHEFGRLRELAGSPEFAEVRKLIEPELSAFHDACLEVRFMVFKLKSNPGIADIHQFSQKALDEARALLLREEVAAGRLALGTGQSPAATEQAATSAASEVPAAPATAEPAAAAESTTAKIESTIAAEKSWLTRVGETVKANKGKTAVATLAAAGLSYAAYEALREKTPTSDVAIGK